MQTAPPEWVKDAIFYQIFPDRFSRSLKFDNHDGSKFKPWGAPPERQGFQGGNIDGITERLDYLQELGVNALYLTPVFASACNHRYHTYDYYSIDPILGGNRSFARLIEKIHSRGMRIMLDGVFNHTGRGFWAFHHILENGGDSPYVEWFKIHGWPLYAYDDENKHKANYSCWAGNRALPQFNMDNPAVRKHLLDAIRYWIDMGVDGWRLDAPHEIERLDFWEDLRKTAKSSNKNVYLCGEYWFVGDSFREDRRFDGLTNYPFSLAALGFFTRDTLREDYENGPFKYRKLDVEQFSNILKEIFTAYPWENCCANMNILDSHDTGRALWTTGYDNSALRLSVLFQMTAPGAPCIYYGDEIGLRGGPDPGCREAFPWHERETWDFELLEFYKKATTLRNRHQVLRQGDFKQLYKKDGVFVFSRSRGEKLAIIALNANTTKERVRIPAKMVPADFTRFEDIWNGSRDVLSQKDGVGFSVPARAGVALLSRKNNDGDERSNKT